MDIVTNTKMRFRKEQWKQIILDREASGLSVAAWCKQNGVVQSTYFKWLHRIRLEACQSLPEIQTVTPVPFVKVESHEVPQISAPQQRPAIQIHACPERVMLGDITQARDIYIACGYTDMRKSIDGLAAIVQQQFQLDPFARDLFLFCGRKRDRIKALLWEGDGFVLLYKRLEGGSFNWPRQQSEVKQLTRQQFNWLLEGLSIEQPKAIKQVSNPGNFC